MPTIECRRAGYPRTRPRAIRRGEAL